MLVWTAKRNFLKTLTLQQPCDSLEVPSQPLLQNGPRIVDYGQRNSLKTINVDGEHFIRFRGKSCVIRLSVDVASVCTVCTLRGLCFGVTDSLYSNVTCSVRETD